MAQSSFAVPRFVREVLFAPECPPPAALLFEVALTHHNTGSYEAAVNSYMDGLSAWEDALLFAEFESRGLIDDETAHAKAQRREAAAAAEAQQARREAAAAEAAAREAEAKRAAEERKKSVGLKLPSINIGSVGSRSGGSVAASSTSTARASASAPQSTVDASPVVSPGRHRSEPAVEEENEETLFVPDGHYKKVEMERERNDLTAEKAAMVPTEGRIFVHLAVGSVFESAPGNDERALAEYSRALKLAQAKVPVHQTNLITATIYSMLGTVYAHLSQYDLAADYFFRALEVREQNLGPDHVDVAALLNNVGCVLILLQKRADALALFTKAGHILERQLDKAHPRRELVMLNERLARRDMLADAEFPAVPFTPYVQPMIPGAVKAKEFYQPKKKPPPKKTNGR